MRRSRIQALAIFDRQSKLRAGNDTSSSFFPFCHSASRLVKKILQQMAILCLGTDIFRWGDVGFIAFFDRQYAYWQHGSEGKSSLNFTFLSSQHPQYLAMMECSIQLRNTRRNWKIFQELLKFLHFEFISGNFIHIFMMIKILQFYSWMSTEAKSKKILYDKKEIFRNIIKRNFLFRTVCDTILRIIPWFFIHILELFTYRMGLYELYLSIVVRV